MADPMNPDEASAWGAMSGTPVPAAPPTPAPVVAPTGDPAVWTLLGETGTDPHGLLGVASTIANRAAKSKKSYQDIVTDPSQGYEAWNDPAARARVQKQYPAGSPEYNAALGVLGDIQSGKTQPLPYTHFYSPAAQAKLGRPVPAWAQGDGTDIAGNRFYTVGDNGAQPAPGGMNPDEQSAWDAIAGNIHQGPPSYSFPAGTRSITPNGDTFKGPNGETYKRDPQDSNFFTDASGARYHIVDPNAPRPRADKYIPGDQLGPELTDAQLRSQYQTPATIEKPIVDTGVLGAVDAFGRKAANAITGGYADKAAALVSALPHADDGTLPPSGGTFEGAYSNALTRERAQDQQAGIFQPVSSAIGTGTGALAQGFLLPEVKAASLGGRLAAGFGQGAALGALNASGQARGDFGDVVSQSIVPTLAGGVAGAGLNAALGPVRPSNDALGAYSRVPVDPTLAVNGGRTMQQIGQTLKGLPIIGIPLSRAALRTSGQLDEGILGPQGAAGYGRSTNAAQAGGALQEGAAAARDTLQAGVADAYKPLNPLEASPNLVPASNTAQAIADLKARYPNTPEWFRSNAPTIARLGDTLEKNNGHLTYGELKNIRTDVGSLSSGHIGNDVNTVDQAALDHVYGAMSKDMENGVYNTAYQQAWKASKNPDVARQAGLDAQTQLVAANATNQHMRDTVTNTLLPIMDAKSPEAAFEKILGMASSGSSRADINSLNATRAALPPEAWNEVAAGTIARMGREGNDASGAFSPDKFATAIGKLSPEGRAAIFGTGENAQDIAAFEQIAKDQKAAAKFYNHSQSGNVLATLSGGGALTVAAQQAFHGNFAPAVMTALGGLAGISAAKLLSSPGAARFLLDVTRAKPSMIDDMFTRYASTHPDIAPQLSAIRKRLPGVATAVQQSGSQPTANPGTAGAALPQLVQ